MARLNQHTLDFLTSNPEAKILPRLLNDHLNYSRGFLRAYHSSLVNFPLGNMHETYRTLGQCFHKPVKMIWGISDNIVPYSNSEILQSLVPNAQLVSTEGRHDIILTHP